MFGFGKKGGRGLDGELSVDAEVPTQDRPAESRPDSMAGTWQRISWHKNVTRLSLVANVVLAASVGVMACMTYLSWSYEAKPKYFAVTPSFQIKRLTPLDQPAMSKSGMLDWATKAVTETLTLNFVNIEGQLTAVRDLYTEDAFMSMINALKESGNLKYILDNRLVMHAVPKAPPTITNEGTVQGRMFWRLQIPLKLGYESSGGTATTQSLIATVLVQRVSPLKHANTLAIARIVLKPE